MGMLSRRTNNFTESGRGLGHMTPTIFGSTVGYPSDSLASCYSWMRNCCLMTDVQSRVFCLVVIRFVKCVFRSQW